jgi:hypothetical protein
MAVQGGIGAEFVKGDLTKHGVPNPTRDDTGVEKSNRTVSQRNVLFWAARSSIEQGVQK